VVQLAPAIFTANGRGQGVAAATAVRILADGSQQPVAVFNCTAAGQCTAVPIDLTSGRSIYLSLYGTGFRGAPQFGGGQPLAKCQAGGTDATVQFAGAQPTIPGLDQINILLPVTLTSGTATVQCEFAEGSRINPVQVEIK